MFWICRFFKKKIVHNIILTIICNALYQVINILKRFLHIVIYCPVNDGKTSFQLPQLRISTGMQAFMYVITFTLLSCNQHIWFYDKDIYMYIATFNKYIRLNL